MIGLELHGGYLQATALDDPVFVHLTLFNSTRAFVSANLTLAEVEQLRDLLATVALCAGRGHDALPTGAADPTTGTGRVYRCQRCASEWTEFP